MSHTVTTMKGTPVNATEHPVGTLFSKTGTGEAGLHSRRGRLLLLGVLSLLVFVGCVGSAAAAVTEFGSAGDAGGQFSTPSGVAVFQQSGAVYVADGPQHRVEKFGPQGEFLLAWGWGVADGAKEPQTCTVSCGAGVGGAGGGQFAQPQGIAVDNAPFSPSFGDVYVIDAGNNRVEKFDSEGHFLLAFGAKVNATTEGGVCLAGESCQAGAEGTGPGEFANIAERAVAVDAAGTVYVGDENRVQEFNEAGGFLGEVALAGAGRTRALVVDSAKDLYVVSNERSGVREYDGTGKELGAPRASAFPRSLAIGPGDELLVDQGPDEEHRMLAFSSAGSELASFDSGPSGGGNGIAWGEKAERVYLLDAEHSRVRLIALPSAGPLVVSESAGEVGTGSVVLGGVVNPEGAPAEYHFEYGTTVAYGQSTPVSAPLGPVDEVQSATVAASGGTFTLAFEGQATGEIPFNATAAEVQTALEAVPGLGVGQVAVTGEPGGPWSVRFTGALAGRDVSELTADPAGLTGPEPGVEPSAVVATSTPGVSLFDERAASATVNELQPDTTYHYRLVATNGSQTAFGEDQTFTILPAVSVGSESVSQVTGESARLATVLNAHGLPTTYHFEYGPTAAYGTSIPEPDASAGSSAADATFEVLLEGLTADTEYHYRVTATNTLGTVHGPDRVFKTRAVAQGLADGRGWEQVSQVNKHGVSLEGMAEEGSVIQAAADGSGIAYIAKAPVDTEPQGNRSIADTQLLASHGAAGWSTKDIATAHEHPAGFKLGTLSEYKLFSSDLSVGFVEPEGATKLSADTGERTPYAGHPDGCTAGLTWCYTPLANPTNVTSGAKYGGVESEEAPEIFTGGVRFAGATEDGRTAALESPQDLTTPVFKAEGRTSLYRWQHGTLTLISVLPNGAAAASEELTSSLGNSGSQVRGAVSGDGNRFVFETGHETEHHLWVRDVVRGETVQVDVPRTGVRGGSGSPVFQVASRDGRRVFFTDAQRLVAGGAASGEPDLYVCEVGVVGGHLACTLKDLTVDEHAGESANVLGTVIGIGGEGQYVYYVANGRLATGATKGDCTGAGAGRAEEASVCNLYVEDVGVGRPVLVGVLSGRDAGDWRAEGAGTNLREVTARVSGGGRWLAFMSLRSLTGFDNRDVHGGVADQEVFLFDRQTGRLSCVSCAASGARPAGVFDAGEFPGLLIDRPAVWRGEWLAGSLPGWTNTDLGDAFYQSRYLSDSGRLFFNSAVGLVAGDANAKMDVYQFEPSGVGGCVIASGCVSLLSGGSSGEESALLDASVSGDDVFFLSAAKLAPGDSDSSFDVYDAHVCTTGWACPAADVTVPPSCSTADSCRAAPVAQPAIFGAPASATFSGPASTRSPQVTAPVKLTRAQQLAKVLKSCRKDKNKKRRSTCEKSAHKKYGAKEASAKRRKK